MRFARLEKRLEELASWKYLHPDNPEPQLQITSIEGERLSEIMIRDSNGQPPTEDDIRFMQKILRRPLREPPERIAGPRCNACGQQPARERDGSLPLCNVCYLASSQVHPDFDASLLHPALYTV